MIKNLIFLTLLFAVFSITAFSQIKQISANDFYTSYSNGHKILYERSYKMETKTETMEAGNLVKSVDRIEERLLPDKFHSIEIEKVGDKETKNELIRIGYMQYSRQNSEPWTVKDLRGGSGSGNGSGSGSSVSCVQFTEEPDFVNGIPARKTRQYLIERSSDGLTYDDFANWIAQDGALVKSERSKGLLEPKVERTHSVVTFEYDPKITIEAPIK